MLFFQLKHLAAVFFSCATATSVYLNRPIGIIYTVPVPANSISTLLCVALFVQKNSGVMGLSRGADDGLGFGEGSSSI